MAEDQQNATFAREEVEEAFAHWWKVGCVDEDWGAWVDLFVPDVLYHDHFWGPLHGREEVALWIAAVMKGVPEIYTVLNWYTVDGDKVVFHCENRRDNPHDEGPDYWDFSGLSMIRYAGDGLWASEEDFWDLPGARRTSAAYAEACRRAHADTPEKRMTRRFWPEGPAWARTDAPPGPSWVGFPDVRGITKPRELAEILGRDLIGQDRV